MGKFDKNRRLILSASVLGVLMGGLHFIKNFSLSKKTSVQPKDKATLVEEFLTASGDAERYREQISLSRNEVVSGAKARFPEIAQEIDSFLSDEYWNYHMQLVTSGVRRDIEDQMSAEHLHDLLVFFKTPAGQSYLKWKAKVQSRDSHTFEAFKQRSLSYTDFIRKLTNMSGEKSKPS